MNDADPPRTAPAADTRTAWQPAAEVIRSSSGPFALLAAEHVHQGLLARRIERLGRAASLYGLVVVLAWIGAMKFTAYEAEGIAGLVRHSPLLSWAFALMGPRRFAAAVGIVELLIAALLAALPWRPAAGALGAAAAVGMFATTLSFLLTTPGTFEPTAGGFPALAVVPGQFLLKDLALLGIAVRALGEALSARRAKCGGLT